jgi:hypothetical protein
MTVTPIHGWGLAALVLFILWRLYRRYRSHMGPQKVRPLRMSIRVILFTVIGGLILFSPLGWERREVVLAAIAAGGALGWLSLGHTHFETRDGRRWYTPNVYIGLGVTALLAVRVLYRLSQIYLQVEGGAAPAAPSGMAALFGGQQSTWTLLPLGVVIGYYAVYYGGVLWRSRQAPTPAASAPLPEGGPQP